MKLEIQNFFIKNGTTAKKILDLVANANPPVEVEFSDSIVGHPHFRITDHHLNNDDYVLILASEVRRIISEDPMNTPPVSISFQVDYDHLASTRNV